MTKKIKVTHYGRVHFHAGCNSCNFNAAIDVSKDNTHEEVRNAVRKHVYQTGHKCWIESGTHTLYSLEDVSETK